MPYKTGKVMTSNGKSPGSPGSNDDSSNSTAITPESDALANDSPDGLGAEGGFELEELRARVGRSPRESDVGERPLMAHTGEDEDLSDVEEDEDEDGTGDAGKSTRRTSVASFELYTPEEERRVRRKLDTHLVLFVALLYMMSFLDRSNIGNAKVAGLMNDLKLSNDQFEWLLTAFYITYILFEWMTLCYKIFPPHIYISCCVCAWGILASMQALSTGWPYLLTLRILLGIGEAAFVGIPFYLSFFFRREELALRIGLFIAAAPLATTFASSLAWAIVALGDGAGIASWRLLFLVEGFPACLVAVWAWWWIPDAPNTARWLTEREKKIATLRMRKEAAPFANAEKIGFETNLPRHKRRFRWNEVVSTIMDPKSYLTAGMFFCCNVAFSSMPVFLPSIINSLGFSKLASQGLAAPPFLLAFFVVIATAFISDRLKSRSVPMMVHASLALFGYAFAAAAGMLHLGPTVRYLAVFPICAGFFSAVTIVITWTVNNQASDEGKGTSMAVLNIFGQMGPLLGTRLYPDHDAPYYVVGNTVCAVAMLAVGALAFALRWVLKRENTRKKAKRKALESRALVGETRAQTFVYML